MLSSHIFNDSLRCQNSSLRLQGGGFRMSSLWEERVRPFDLQFLRQHLKGQYIKILIPQFCHLIGFSADIFKASPRIGCAPDGAGTFPPPQLCVYSVYMRRRLMIVSVVSMTYCRDFLLFPTVFPNSTCQNSQRIPCRPAWLTAESDLPPHRWSHAVLFLQGFLTQLRCSDFLVLSHTKETP